MKIIHTADWHIGAVLYGYDRREEHIAAFDALKKIIQEEQPDVLLVCGDIFHNPRPSAAAQSLFTKVLTGFKAVVPAMTIVVTAGNHDSPSLHEIFRDAWQELGVHAIGSANGTDDELKEKLIVEVPGKCFIAAVPYLYDKSTMAEKYRIILEEIAKINEAGLPVIAMAHANVPFGEEDEKRDYVGAVEPCEIGTFGTGYDYLALGHIHRTAGIPGTNARYCGSIIPITFGEKSKRSVSKIEIERHGERPRISTIEIATMKPVVSVPANGFKGWNDAIEELKEYEAEGAAYVRLCINHNDEIPANATEIASAICTEKGLDFCVLNYPTLDLQSRADGRQNLSIEEFKQMTPAEVAKMYVRDTGLEFNEDLEGLFTEVLDALEAEKKGTEE